MEPPPRGDRGSDNRGSVNLASRGPTGVLPVNPAAAQAARTGAKVRRPVRSRCVAEERRGRNSRLPRGRPGAESS